MKTWLRLALITMTVGGGFAGVVLAWVSLVHSQDHGPLKLALVVGFLGLYIFVTASGLLFVSDPRRTLPLLVALAVQIPWISTPLIVYKFAAGFYAVITLGEPHEVGITGIHLGGEFLLGSTFRLAWSQDIPWSIGVNLWALLLLILLYQSIQTPSSVQPTTSVASDSRTG